MRILFLDQSSKLGGAELSLLDVATPFKSSCMVGLFQSGPFCDVLEQRGISFQALSEAPLKVRKDSSLAQGLRSLRQLLPLILKTAHLSRQFDLIYANTPKAFLVGALASALSPRPLVYHLRDIISPEHFSRFNRLLLVILANRMATLILANSEATKRAFIQEGGCADKVQVVYNGFDPDRYEVSKETQTRLRQQLELPDQFIVGHFSRIAPWKGQHILINALAHCPQNIVVLLVGDALFGEEGYLQQLHQQVDQLRLHQRVKFLGFRHDIPELMATCSLIAHTSIAPEPFGRVIIEGMLSKRPVVAAAAGGALELIDADQTGWLTPPGDEIALARVIHQCQKYPDLAETMANQSQRMAKKRFALVHMHQQIAHHLNTMLS